MDLLTKLKELNDQGITISFVPDIEKGIKITLSKTIPDKEGNSCTKHVHTAIANEVFTMAGDVIINALIYNLESMALKVSFS